MKKLLLALIFLSVGELCAQDTIYVNDFGARENSFENCVQAIQDAIAECKKSGAKVLAFRGGRYDIWADGASRREYFISNTSNEKECPSKVKTIGMLFDGVENLVIEGNNSKIVFHNKMITVAFDNCRNVKLQNIEIDFERPTMSEIKIEALGSGFVDVSFHRDSRYSIVNGRIMLMGEGWRSNQNHCIEFDPNLQTMRYSGLWNELEKCPAAEIAPGRVRFAVPEKLRPSVGNILTVRDIIRDQVGAFNLKSKDITYSNVRMRYMHGLGIVSQFVENVTMDRVYCEPDAASGRVTAASADFMHFSGCRGLVKVVDCRFAGSHDDPVNVHGTNLRVVENLGKNRLKLRFMHHQSYGFDAFFNGDEVAFVNAKKMLRYAMAHIKKVEKLSEREVIVTLDGEIPKDLTVNEDCLENITWTPEVLIKGNFFSRTSTRGVLLTTPRKAVIEDNTFFNCGMSAILIEADAQGWYESGPVCDVTIRNNTFIDCGYQGGAGGYIIALHPSNSIIDADNPVHRNVTIEDNIFITYDIQVLYAKSTQGLAFRNNVIRRSFTMPSVSSRNSSFLFDGCKNVIIENITFEGDVLGRDILTRNMPDIYLDNRTEMVIKRTPKN